MSSAWIEKRPRKSGVTYRVKYRIETGQNGVKHYAGSFTNRKDAERQVAWVRRELAAGRKPPSTTELYAPEPPRQSWWRRLRGRVA